MGRWAAEWPMHRNRCESKQGKCRPLAGKSVTTFTALFSAAASALPLVGLVGSESHKTD